MGGAAPHRTRPEHKELSEAVDFNSHNARRLDVDEMAAILEDLPFIRNLREGKAGNDA